MEAEKFKPGALPKLIKIQEELKAPKSNYNNFGKFNYRSCEDILEAVKPLCVKNGCVLILTDEIQQIGNRHYVRATAELFDQESGDKVQATAFAREAENKKGMDEAQVSGTTSSYARKYALNGLFCIDDAKDSDTDENIRQQREADKAPKESERKPPSQKVNEGQVEHVVEMCDKHHKDVADMLTFFKLNTVEEMTVAQYEELKKIFKED